MDCLHHLEREHDVTILFAAESGSRAWGFPSPDSDYDVRFVYAHRRDWYLSIEPARRDVIEQAIEADLDVSGWDLRKALGLALKPNPVLHEWLMSPIVYRQHDAMAAKLREFTSVVLAATPPVGHYNGLCASQSNRHVRDR
ncbi:MAG: nucleotidyltransferase domain-containing protein, partial [Sphingomonadaceae bacterium]|nr:nucleotidyltransferase domain-containing protein [Sphingomonadaceae bacterium]